VSVVATVAISGWLGCGSPQGDANNQGGGGDTVVSPGKPLGELTPSEAAQVCEDASPALRAVSCNLAGFISASYSAAYDTTLTDDQLKAACSTTASACQSQLAQPDCSAISRPPGSCMATVGEYFACLEDTVALVPDCSATTRAMLTGTGPNLAKPASCETLAAKCPGIDN
jgi:hypothetical protein